MKLDDTTRITFNIERMSYAECALLRLQCYQRLEDARRKRVRYLDDYGESILDWAEGRKSDEEKAQSSDRIKELDITIERLLHIIGACEKRLKEKP